MSSNQGNVFSVFALVSCSQLAGVAPGGVFCCCSPSVSSFNVFCIQRCSSACLRCIKRLFELLVPLRDGHMWKSQYISIFQNIQCSVSGTNSNNYATSQATTAQKHSPLFTTPQLSTYTGQMCSTPSRLGKFSCPCLQWYHTLRFYQYFSMNLTFV